MKKTAPAPAPAPVEVSPSNDSGGWKGFDPRQGSAEKRKQQFRTVGAEGLAIHAALQACQDVPALANLVSFKCQFSAKGDMVAFRARVDYSLFRPARKHFEASAHPNAPFVASVLSSLNTASVETAMAGGLDKREIKQVTLTAYASTVSTAASGKGFKPY